LLYNPLSLENTGGLILPLLLLLESVSFNSLQDKKQQKKKTSGKTAALRAFFISFPNNSSASRCPPTAPL